MTLRMLWNHARFVGLSWLLENTEVGRAVLFNVWSQGFSTGQLVAAAAPLDTGDELEPGWHLVPPAEA